MAGSLRVLELYCGIGGCAAALGERAEVVCAVDIHRAALDVYAFHFPHPVRAATIESIPFETWRDWNADLWWLSPPCQPYTTRGRRRDLDDPRAASLVAVLQRLRDVRPRYLALENVPGFLGSRAHACLRTTLADCGYDVRERVICPTELGVPNRRRRYYLVAGRPSLASWSAPAPLKRRFTVGQCLEPEVAAELWLPAEIVARYRGALHVVDPQSPQAETSCFTAAYGRSFVRSGSYLLASAGVRRFSPREILRLLGFPDSFRLPPQLSFRQAWPLVGNSLSVFAVRVVLAAIPELSQQREDPLETEGVSALLPARPDPFGP